jgi:hypothetical protein
MLEFDQDHFDRDHRAPSLANGDEIRVAVQQLHTALRGANEDPTQCYGDFVAALAPLAERHAELFASVEPRRLSEINPDHRLSTIYFDPSLMIQIVGAPKGFRLPTHSHSAWNVLYVCEGEMAFTWYRRLDDRSVAGRADLEAQFSGVIRAGDAGMVAPPPHDIHDLEVLSDYLWWIVVTPEPEGPIREIYSPNTGTYKISTLASAAAEMAA